MTMTKVSNLEGIHLLVRVTDYISKKQYFDDSEITGWVMLQEQDEPKLYHMYQRGYENGEWINEPFIDVQDPITSNRVEKEKQTMLHEMDLQLRPVR